MERRDGGKGCCGYDERRVYKYEETRVCMRMKVIMVAIMMRYVKMKKKTQGD